MMKKLFTMFLALAAVAALAAGVVACDDGEKNSGGTETEVTVAGGYAYYPPDQGGYGLELNLYEDGTFYFSQFTQTVTYGEYSAAEATGTDENGNTIFYTVTFENDPFVAAGGTATHNVVQTADGAVQLTNMYDSMSKVSYSFSKQDEFIQETAITVAQYWSENFAEDYVRVAFRSDDTYSLEGVNGLDDAGIPLAGSEGTYTSATAEDGTVTYTMTDGKDSSKVYTLTVGTDEITLSDGEKTYSMVDEDPTMMEFLVLEAKITDNFSDITAVITLLNDEGKTWSLSTNYYGTGDNVLVSGTWEETNDGIVLTVTEDENSALENDSYTLALNAETNKYGATIGIMVALNGDQGNPSLEDFVFEQTKIQEPSAETIITFNGTATDPAQSWLSAKIEVYSDETWTLFLDYSQGQFTEAAKGTYAMGESYAYVLTVTDDSGEMLAEDSYTIGLASDWSQYSAKITLNIPMVGGAEIEFTAPIPSMG